MNRIALCTLVFVASVAAFQPVRASDAATKCVAEFTEVRWPYARTTLYTPNTTNFRFVCAGISGARTIPQLYQLGWSLVGLPWREGVLGSNSLTYAIWIER